MAFANNQQDAFNLRNDTESLKQWQSELDKATTSIGAAEVAAEEELAALKFSHLMALQNAQMRKLDELLEKEEAGIRKLAALRLELSDKQFEARKKEIQKELQLLEDAINELQEPEVKKAKKPEDPTAKQTSDTKDVTSDPKARQIVPSEKAPTKDARKATDPDLIKLVGSIDKTLSSLHSTIAGQNQYKEKDVVADIKSDNKPQQPTTANIKNIQAASKNILVEEEVSATKEMQEAAKAFEAEANRSKANEIPQPDLETPKKAPIKEAETKAQPSLINLVSSIDKTLESLLDTVSKQPKEKGTSLEEDKRSSVTNDIIEATQQTQDETAAKSDGKPPMPDSNENKQPPKEEKQFANDTSLLDTVDIGHYSFKAVFGAFETLKDSIQADASVLNTLNQVTATGKDGEAVASQTSIDLAGDLLVSIKQTEAAKQKLQEFTANKELNLRLAAQKKEQDRARQYQEEYYNLLMECGDYAVSLEEYKADQERKRSKTAKKETTEGLVASLQKFGTGEFSKAAVKAAYGKYQNTRKAELKDKYNNEKLKDGKTRREQVIEHYKNEGKSEEEATQLAEEKAEASAKLTANFELLAEAAGGLAATLDIKVKEIASMQGFVDTRLQGSRVNDRDFVNGSYWNELLEEVKWIAGASPFVKQEKIVDNLKDLINRGISFDVKQRAFLMTIQEKVANTFNVADGTLLRLIRIQQQDTTAGRLGMESALNSFLNSMYETSEYLTDVAKSVRGSLEEMQALMEGAAGTELEFQVQKWMGSLYSVGMSDNAVQDIARTFGQIVSGDISGLTGNGTGNLLIMAANEAGISIADILQEGLDADETNKLMQAMVNYLAEIAEMSSDSRVVQQQLANVYGIKASDLRAATNLASSIKDVSKQDLTYSGMMGQLNNMMNTIRFRTSIGEGMTNMWDNMMYTMASTQASNPMLYLLPKMADLLRDVTGGDGIALPFINAMGFGVDLNTSVADLMSVASLSGTVLGSLVPVLAGLSDLVNPLVGSTMLVRAGINPLGKAPVLARGSATPFQNLRGFSLSESGYVGQGSGDDIKKQTLIDADDEKNKLMVEAKDEEAADDVTTQANLAVVNIYNLLEEVAHGSQSLRVRVVNNGNVLSAGGNFVSGQNTIIGDNSNDGTTSFGAGKNGTDNGNWVLSF